MDLLGLMGSAWTWIRKQPRDKADKKLEDRLFEAWQRLEACAPYRIGPNLSKETSEAGTLSASKDALSALRDLQVYFAKREEKTRITSHSAVALRLTKWKRPRALDAWIADALEEGGGKNDG